MREGSILIVNRLGLHARAAAKLVKSAEKFNSRILITSADGTTTVNAKSILSVLTLAASKGKRLTLSAEGSDEDSAFETIAELFACGFGEV